MSFRVGDRVRAIKKPECRCERCNVIIEGNIYKIVFIDSSHLFFEEVWNGQFGIYEDTFEIVSSNYKERRMIRR